MIHVDSIVHINMNRLNNIEAAAVRALEQTGEELHTKIVQDQVVPRMDGDLQGKAFFVDKSESSSGTVHLVHSTPYARRMYYHPEYKFHRAPWSEDITDKEGKTHHYEHDGNPNAKGKWFEDYEPGGKESNFAPDTFREKMEGLI